MYGDNPVTRGTVAAWVGLCIFGFMTSMKQGGVVGQPVPFCYWIVLAKILHDELRAAHAREQHDFLYGAESYDAPLALEYGEKLEESPG